MVGWWKKDGLMVSRCLDGNRTRQRFDVGRIRLWLDDWI